MDKTQTNKLLKSYQDDPLIQKCISLLDDSLPHETTISEPTIAQAKDLKSIYMQRLTVHKNLRLSTIEVSEKLFDALDKEADEYIAVFEIRFPFEVFMIFTDSQIKRIIGGIYIR